MQLPFQKPRLPHYILPEGFSSNHEYLIKLANEGFVQRGLDKKDNADEYKQRLE